MLAIVAAVIFGILWLLNSGDDQGFLSFAFLSVSVGCGFFAYTRKRILEMVDQEIRFCLQKERLEARLLHGVLPRNKNDEVVDRRQWVETENIQTDWLEGETRKLLPDDLVLRWNYGAWGGVAIERNGRIVASRQEWHMELNSVWGK